jgi:prepilin-type N-terminal cleavage/methylation domain-containing protein
MTRVRLLLGDRRGFTLAELLVAMAMTGLVMAAVFVLQREGEQAYLLGSSRVEAQQNARSALDLMTRELRSAKSIASVSGSTDIMFVDQCGKNIRYSLSDATLNRTGPITVYPDCSNPSSTTPLIGRVQSFAMTYYSVYDVSTGTYTTTSTPGQVKVIKISVVSETDESGAEGSPRNQRATMESTVQLRNLS